MKSLINIWFRPRRAVSESIQERADLTVHLLAILGALLTAYDNPAVAGTGDSLTVSIVAWVVAGVLMGVIGLYVLAEILTTIGNWLGGEGDSYEVRHALGWSRAPEVPALLFVIYMVVRYGHPMFVGFGQYETAPAGFELQLMLLGLLALVGGVWSFVILGLTLADVQKLPVWKGYLLALIPFLMSLLLFLITAVIHMN